MLLILLQPLKRTTWHSLIISQISSRTQGLNTSSTTSKVALFDMLSATSQNHYTLSKYVSSIIPTMLILMLKPLPKPLQMINLGILSVHNLFELLFAFSNQMTTLKPLLRKNSSLFDKDQGINLLFKAPLVTQTNTPFVNYIMQDGSTYQG